MPPYIIEINPNNIHIDPGKLPVPENQYDADFGWVDRRGGAASFFFAKADIDNKDRLRTRMEIRVAWEPFLSFCDQSQDFTSRMGETIKGKAIYTEEVSGKPRTMRADKDYSEWATLGVLTQSGGQGQIDFFNLPQCDIVIYHSNRDTSRLVVHPVVRVLTTPSVLLHVSEEAIVLGKAIRAELPVNAERSTDENT